MRVNTTGQWQLGVYYIIIIVVVLLKEKKDPTCFDINYYLLYFSRVRLTYPAIARNDTTPPNIHVQWR